MICHTTGIAFSRARVDILARRTSPEGSGRDVKGKRDLRNQTCGQERNTQKLTDCQNWWDNPTMTSKVDAKRRVVIPGARPGDVYDIQRQGDGRILLVRLERPEPGRGMSRSQCLRAMDEAPLPVNMSWDELKSLTREP